MKPWEYTKRVIKVAVFVAEKSIRRGSIMAKTTMVLILMLTFLNLTVVGGLLNGVIKDLETTAKDAFVGDVYIEPSEKETYIQDMEVLTANLNEKSVSAYSPRLLRDATLEYNYKTTKLNKVPPHTASTLTGVHPKKEALTSTLPENIAAGRFLREGEWDSIVLGASLVEGYGSAIETGADTLGGVSIGDKVRANFLDGTTFEFTVVGIIHTKLPTIDRRAYVSYKTLHDLSGLSTNKYSEIAAKTDGSSSLLVKKLEKAQERGGYYQNKIQKGTKAIPQVTSDMEETFSVINHIVEITAILIGLVTIFVIIFINVTNRQRELGLLKAQGISAQALILSYIFQALFYTLAGISLGLATIYLFLEGYFQRNPLITPVADGNLILNFNYLIFRVAILMASAVVSGFVPSWYIIKQNTLDSILGR